MVCASWLMCRLNLYPFIYLFRTPIDNIGSPGKLDAIMKSLQNSPKPLFPAESRTPPVSQGFSTCSEDTEVQEGSASNSPPTKTGDFSALEFGEDIETQENSTPDKEEGTRPISLMSDSVELPQKQDARPQNLMQTFGYQQRMNFNVEHGFGAFHHKPMRNKKKKKKWNQMQNFFQQQGRNPQVAGDNNFGNFNMNPQANLRPQQGVGTQWRGQSQNAPANFPVGNQFYCGGPTAGQDQGPRPQSVGPGNFAGNFPQQAPSLPNFNVPPPNMSPMDFFRKVPPPNFRQQTQPIIPQQPQQNPLIPPQQVPPPPLQNNQSQFFPPTQPSPYTRLPPPPPFQANVSTPPPSQFPQSNPLQQQFPQSMQAGFPPQQNQFQFNSPLPNLGIAAAQPANLVGKITGPLQQQSGPSEPLPHPDVGSFSLQTGAVTTSTSETYESREGFPSDSEPCTPSPVKHKPPAHLPPHWKSATDQQGKVYYYHALTR